MLQSVQIEGFRSCKESKVNFDTSLVALLGRNGAGKTNVLRGIDWLARNATSLEPPRRESTSVLRDKDSTAVTITAKLGKDRLEFMLRRTSVVRTNDYLRPEITLDETLVGITPAGRRTLLFSRSGDKISIPRSKQSLSLGTTAPALPTLSAMLPAKDPLLPKVRKVLDFLNAIAYHPLDEPMDQVDGVFMYPVVFQESYNEWRSGGGVTGDHRVHMDLVRLFLDQHKRWLELKSLLEPTGLGILRTLDITKSEFKSPVLSASGEETESTRTMYILRMVPIDAGNQFSFGYPELSAGTRRIIRLLIHLVCDDNSVMLIEQPEDSIHPALAIKLLGLIKAYSSAEKVVLITTHSSSILDSLTPSEIRFVTMEDGSTVVRALSERELGAAKTFLESEGNMSEFIRYAQR